MKRAMGYVRMSKDEQELSPEVQRYQLNAYCQFKGLAVAGVIDDSGISASIPFAERDGGGELLARFDDFDEVVFAKLDRAFRDTVDCITTVDRIRAAGKIVHFIDLGIDTSTAMGQAFMEMSAVFAKLERRRISDRTKEALAAAQRKGKRLGAVPFGERSLAHMVDGKKVDGGVYVPVESEQHVIDRIRLLRSGPKPKTFRDIAAALNREGVPTKRGRTWRSEQVRRIAGRV